MNDQIANLIQRAVSHSFDVAVTIAGAGARMAGPPTWGRHAEVRRELELARAGLYAELGLVGAAIEILDGQTVGGKALD